MARRVEKEWPRLQCQTKLDKTKYWIIRVFEEDGNAFIETEYWQDDGAHQTAPKQVLGKNIGKANETTPLAQALSEAASQFQKQLDKGYSEDGAGVLEYELPMLAHDYNKRMKSIAWPCYVQPKLDGFRCLFDTGRGFWSRSGKPFDKTVDLSHLQFDTQGVIFDGELILPNGYTFQQTCEAAKKQRETTPLLELHIFDIVLLGTTFEWRWNWLAKFFLEGTEKGIIPAKVKLVATHIADDFAHAQAFFGNFVEQGYEGLMLRNTGGPYLAGHRSADLQKYKEFQDGEYAIVDVVDGVGREAGAAIFVCRTDKNQEFQVRPRGGYDDRRRWFSNKAKLIGQPLTVRYQNLTDDGVPRFPVGVGIRPDWDL